MMLTRETNPVNLIFGFMMLVIVLHLKTMFWLSRPVTENKVNVPLPLEVILVPVPEKVEVEPVKPKPVIEPKKPPSPPKPKPKPKAVSKPKPAPVQKPKPVVQAAAPVVKPVLPKPIAPVIQTPIASPSQSTFKTPAANPVRSSNNTSSTAVSKSSAVTRSAPDNDTGSGVNSDAVELSNNPKPKYPMRALNRRIEGHVKLEFTISTTGSVIDPVVVSSEPPDIFDAAALQVIQKWKFKPKIKNGNAVEKHATKTITFKLTNQ